MIVLSKKRIVFFVSVLMISFVTIFINGIVYGEFFSNAGHAVILDAGHGEPDRSELLAIAEFLRRKLI